MTEASGRTDARRAERRDTRATSTLRAEGAGPLDVMVLDISATGVRILTNADLAIGQEVSIGLAGAGATRAFVAWRREAEYGCAFTKPLSIEDEARAFSNAAPIELGRIAVADPRPARPDEPDSLEELYRLHRHWRLPGDAVLAILAYLGIALYGLRMLIP